MTELTENLRKALRERYEESREDLTILAIALDETELRYRREGRHDEAGTLNNIRHDFGLDVHGGDLS